MINHFTEYDSEILHRIIEIRRSACSFEKVNLNRESIISVLKSGLCAPYSDKDILKYEDFRNFFVITGESEKLTKINEVIKNNFICISDEYDQNTYEILKDAPCLIIVAEKKDLKYSKYQSLAYVMDNMWLKSASLNLGFRVIPLFEKLSNNEEFCKVLGLECGKYNFNGCIMGYTKNKLSNGKRPHIHEVVKWL